MGRLPKAFASTKPGPAFAMTPLARGKAGQKKQQQQLYGVPEQVSRTSSNQLSASGLCDNADFTAARLSGDTKLD